MMQGSILYCLVKGEDLKYTEGSLVSVSAPRTEMPQMQPGQMMPPAIRSVIDVTFNVDGKTYTEVIGENDTTIVPKTMGLVALVASDKSTILQELRATFKASEDYLKDVERQKKRVSQCKELITQLDTEYAEKQAMDKRMTAIEKGQEEIKSMFNQLLKEIKK